MIPPPMTTTCALAGSDPPRGLRAVGCTSLAGPAGLQSLLSVIIRVLSEYCPQSRSVVRTRSVSISAWDHPSRTGDFVSAGWSPAVDMRNQFLQEQA